MKTHRRKFTFGFTLCLFLMAAVTSISLAAIRAGGLKCRPKD